MKTYNIRRYDTLGHCYGERIYSGTRKECLQYLKDAFARNANWIQKISRHKNYFTAFKALNTYQYHINEVTNENK